MNRNTPAARRDHPLSRATPRERRPERRAFTLIELVVVIVILGVLAAVIAPRFGSGDSRRAEQVARSLRNLLSIAAHRDSLGAERLALTFDHDSNSIVLETFRPTSTGERVWRADPLTPPVSLGPLTLRAAMLDASPLDQRAWRLEFPQHQPRPVIELSLERAASSARWTIILLPGATQAEMTTAASINLLRPIDLDAAGTGHTTW